ncbi:MAG: ribonuclease III domain-containing protein [Lachnospiraceae bacterium]|nr:ribonuclease III domain-containing protein [Lachnospiraceae bacterium]
MEEGLSLLAKIKQTFSVKEVDVRAYSPLTLAYIGDAVYDIIIRTVVVERSNRAANELHKKTSSFVKAQTQAAMAEALWETFSEEEEAVYKRGRNAKSYTTAKNASIADYRKATGLEALIGYLYLQDRTDRVLELVKEGLSRIDMVL